MITHKICRVCKIEKPVSDFFKSSKIDKVFVFKVSGKSIWHSMCKKCEATYKRNPKYKEMSKVRNLTWYHKVKKEVLNYYSNGKMACDCCGENHYEFLSIDHIDGGGNKHRKKMGISNMCSWLKHNNYPTGYKVLCFNCNQAKSIYGICPHKKEVSTINSPDNLTP